MSDERLIDAVLDPDRYPERTAFIAADQEGFGAILGALAFFEHLLTRRRTVKRSQSVVRLPADYHVEIRNRQLAAA